MKRLTGLMAASVCAITLASAAAAMPIPFQAWLSGPNESPPNASSATGFAWVWIDPAAQTLKVQVTFSGLTGTTTASHIHCCTAVAGTGTAGVATEVPSFSNLPLGVHSGSFTEMFDMSLSSSYNPAFVSAHGGTAAGAEAALFAGIMGDMAYLNIHTTAVPSGEIRGFLTPAPEPATIALLGAGVLGAFGARRTLKKA